MTEAKDVSTSSGGTLTVPALTAPVGVSGGLAPALPPGATVSRGVAQTLQRLVDDHNARHGKDRKKRADIRAVRAAYRRGAGRKPKAGRSRRQEGLARAQAHLAALAGKELPTDYAADAELLPGSTKRLAVLAVEGTVAEPLAHLKALGALVEQPAAPAPEQKAEPAAVETKTWSDAARAAALEARRMHTHKDHEGLLDRASQAVEHVEVNGDPEKMDGHHAQQVLHHSLAIKDAVDPFHGEPDYAKAREHVDAIKDHAGQSGDGELSRLARHMDDHLSAIEKSNAAPPTREMLSTAAHRLSQDVRGHDVEGHETARRAHLAAADAHKAAGDEEMALNHVMFADSHRERADQGAHMASTAKPDPSGPPHPLGKMTKHDVDAAELRAGDYLQHSGKHVRVADVQHHGDVAQVRFRDPDLGIGHAYLKHGTTHRVTRVERPDEKQ